MRWAWPLLLVGCIAAPDLQENRRRNLAHLREYTEAGRYPINDEVEGETPIFVDRRGTPCAVAYLMLMSGREDLVRKVVGENNYVRIGELVDGPVLDWIRTSGLTQAECALIQPAYRRRRPPRVDGYRLEVSRIRTVGEAPRIPDAYLARPHRVEPRRIYIHLTRVRWLIDPGGDDPWETDSMEKVDPWETHPWLEAVPHEPPFPPDWRSRLASPTEIRDWTIEELCRPRLRLQFGGSGGAGSSPSR